MVALHIMFLLIFLLTSTGCGSGGHSASKGHATAEEGQAETWNCEHGVHKLENIIHGIIFFAGQGPTSLSTSSRGKETWLSVLLQHCCNDVC